MSIYRLYVQNGNIAGFWVQHRTWRNVCAQVLSVAGQTTGQLPGSPPAHGEATVLIRSFDVRSGRPTELGPQMPAPQDKGFIRIAEPVWSRQHAK
jgi:hypothetical protein